MFSALSIADFSESSIFPRVYFRRVKSWICLENLETCSRSPENIRLPCSALNRTRSLFPDFQIVSESEKTGVSTKRSSQIFEKNWKFWIFGFSDVWKQNLWPKTLDCLEHPKSCKTLDFHGKVYTRNREKRELCTVSTKRSGMLPYRVGEPPPSWRTK